MASLASTFLAPEATSTFLGVSLAKDASISAGPARVSMGYNREELFKKPLTLLRTLARQQGIPITNKNGIIDALVKKGSYSYSPSYSSAPPPTFQSSSSGDASQYASLSLGELRTLARSRGVRGDTKAELIKALLSAPPPATPSASPAATNGAAAARGLPKATLERKSLSELRALARVRGLRGDTKAELVKLLAAPESSSPAPSSGSFSGSVDVGATFHSSLGNGASNVSSDVKIRQLSVKSLSQLRAMASIKGIRGITKDELVKQLAAVL